MLKSNIQNRIKELFIQSSNFAKNDVLVDIIPGKDILQFSGELTYPIADLASILKQANQSLKESGTNPLCKTKGTIAWEIDDKEVLSPLLITPVHFTIDKVRNHVNLHWDDDTTFVNPFVINRLSSHYDKHEQLASVPEELLQQLNAIGFENLNAESSFLGIIHHHRHQLLKELELLQTCTEFSDPLHVLFGEAMVESQQEISTNLLLPADVDHRTCFQMFEQASLCIEGPPGTGKSQILTNFIGKGLIDQHSLLVVSEKKSALDVLNNKLAAFNLDHLAIVGTDNMDNKQFIASLRESWSYFENYRLQATAITTRTEREANLQFVLDIINQPELIGGVDFTTYTEFSKNSKTDDFEYTLDVPSLKSFIASENNLIQLYQLNLQSSIGRIRPTLFAQKQLKKLSKKIEEFITTSKNLKHQGFDTLADIDRIKRQLAALQLFDNELVKQHIAVYQPDSRAQKKFLRLFKKWQKHSTAKQHFETIQTSWKIIPSAEEFQDLTNALEGNYFSRRKAKKRWDEIATVNYTTQSKSIDELKRYLVDVKELQKVETEFQELGLEAKTINSIASSLGLFTSEKWEYYHQIPAELKENGSPLLNQIETFTSDLSTYLELDNFIHIEEQLIGIGQDLHHLIEREEALSVLEASTLKLMAKHADYSSLKNQIIGCHTSNFKQAYPRLANFSMQDLSSKIEACIAATEEEGKITSKIILNKAFTQFQHYGELLSTPARQLSNDEKELKQQLKKGKAILTKEFNKSRQHLSIRELYQSEARVWIQLLKPVWMCNPYLIASLFPLEKGLFDQCIFDEASQLVVQGGLGSIQRANRIVIAGDSQQMEPTSYFKAGGSDQISLLQHAHYYYKKHLLSHHYRSVHPALIEFSNRHFYDHKLMVYPSANIKEHPIQFTFVEDGIFDARQNEAEAKIVAQLIQQRLRTTSSLGIVAFSQTQLDCIWNVLDSVSKEELEQRIEANTAFFKPLEKVQGDECHSLIISFGYGKTLDGEFPMRFGPMNMESGRKRLNVLVTRASHLIDFVASVKAEDFKLSSNESIEILRKWFTYIEQPHLNEHLTFPLGLTPQITKNQLTLNSIQRTTKDAIELITLHSVLENRGWEIVYA